MWEAFKKRGLGWSATPPTDAVTLAGLVEAFDLPPKGTQKWVFPASGALPGAIYSSAAIAADGTIYFGADDGKLYAPNPTTGSKIWEFTEASSPPQSFRSAPIVGPNGTIYARRSNGYLYAINPNGTMQWKVQVYYDSWVSPALGPDGTIYVAGITDLKAVSPQGAILWSFSTGNTIYSSPAIAPDGTIYFGGMDAKVYAVDPNTHLVKSGWPFTTGGGVVSSPALARDGTIYVGSYDGKLYAINPNGTQKWQFNAGAVIRSSPAIAPDGTIHFGCDNYKLYALDPNTGLVKPGWPYITGFYVASSPVVAGDGTIIFGSDDGKVYALKPDGTSVGSPWPFYTGGTVFSSPAIGQDGTVYVGSSNGKFYALSSVPNLAHSPWPMFRQNPWHTGNPATLTLASGVRFGDLDFQFQIKGLSGMVCKVEGSDNLIDWNALPDPALPTLITLPAGGSANFTDVQASGYSHRFYRVSSGPILSYNSLGYAAVNVPPGYSMVANQLDNPAGNTVSVLLPGPPEGTTLYKWNEVGGVFVSNGYQFGFWADPGMTLNPGEGVLAQPGSATTFTFIGDVRQGTIGNPFPAGQSIRGSMVPQTGPLDSLLGFAPLSGDIIQRYNNGAGAYDSYTFTAGAWSPSVPMPGVGESFWVNTGTARTWTRVFTIW